MQKFIPFDILWKGVFFQEGLITEVPEDLAKHIDNEVERLDQEKKSAQERESTASLPVTSLFPNSAKAIKEISSLTTEEGTGKSTKTAKTAKAKTGADTNGEETKTSGEPSGSGQSGTADVTEV